jgi:Ala-tRNA(Pro) deacylase
MTSPPSGAPAPFSPDELFRALAGLGIATTTVAHPPVLTMAESRAVRGELPGAPCKNLLLRDRAGAFYLVVTRESRRLDLKTLAQHLGCARLSFASSEAMTRVLGISAGTATPFAAVNDPGGAIRIALEQSLLDEPQLCFHPLVNTMTTAIAPADLLRFLDAVAHPPRLFP